MNKPEKIPESTKNVTPIEIFHYTTLKAKYTSITFEYDS